MFLWGNNFYEKRKLELWMKHGVRSEHGQISLRTEWLEKRRILSLLYTASYSNHYRHHFNKFGVLWHRRTSTSFSNISVQWMLFWHTKQFPSIERWEKRIHRNTFFFHCFHFLRFYFSWIFSTFSFVFRSDTNKQIYIAKVFLFFWIFLFHCWLLLLFLTCFCKQMCKELEGDAKNYNLGIV